MINRNTPLRYDWQHTHKPGYPRGYFAQVNESLVLNVHRIREGSPTWEYLVVGFDLSQTTAPVIVVVGQAGTMLEGKLHAESKVPPASPRIGQIRAFDDPPPDGEDIPF